MRVEILWKAVASCSDSRAPTLDVVPYVVFLKRCSIQHMHNNCGLTCSIKHFLCDSNGYLDGDPVFGRGTNEVILMEAVRTEPVIHQVNALVVGSDECLDFFLGQVRSVPGVIWIADLIQMRLKHVEIGLRKSNSHLKNVICGRGDLLNPS